MSDRYTLQFARDAKKSVAELQLLYTLEDGEIRIFRVGKRNDDEVYRNL
jgi:hypothetical protein